MAATVWAHRGGHAAPPPHLPVFANPLVCVAMSGAGSLYRPALLSSDRREASGRVCIFIGCDSGSNGNRRLVCHVFLGGIAVVSACRVAYVDGRQTVRDGECGHWTAAGGVPAFLGVRAEVRGDACVVAVHGCCGRRARAAAMDVVRSSCGSTGLRRRCIPVRADGDRQIGAWGYAGGLPRKRWR